MRKEELNQLILDSQNGNAQALEQLLIYAHGPVSFLCRKLLGNEQTAKRITADILRALPAKLDTLDAPSNFGKWIGNITAVRCMKIRGGIHSNSEVSDDQNTSFPGRDLNKEETARVAVILADALPEEERICLYLNSLSGLSVKAIAQLTGISAQDVQNHIQNAQEAILAQMQLYRDQGVTFTQFSSVSALLRTAMYLHKNPKEAAMVVRIILPPPMPVTGNHPKSSGTVKVLAVIAGLVLILLLFLIGCLLKGFREEPTAGTTDDTTQTIATTVPEETSVPTTVETTEVTTGTTTEPTSSPETGEPPETQVSTEPSNQTQPVSANDGSGTNAPGTGSGGWKPVEGPHEHNYVYMSATFGRSATCESPGWSNQICTLCREVGSFPDPVNHPAKGHNYDIVTVHPPTTTSQGYTEHTCSNCYKSYNDSFVDPLPTEAPPAPEPDPAPDPIPQEQPDP